MHDLVPISVVDCGAPKGNYRECGGYGRSGHATSGLNFSDQDLYKDYSGQEHTGNYDGGYTESESPVKKIMIRNVSQFLGILDIDRRLGLDSELLISRIGSYHGERQ